MHILQRIERPSIIIIKDRSLKNGGFVGEFTEPSSGETLFQKAHILNEQIFPAAKGMLFLIRNPYDASIAEFKRIKGHGHTSSVNETIFEQANLDWQKRQMRFIKIWFSLLKNVLKKHQGKLSRNFRDPKLFIILIFLKARKKKIVRFTFFTTKI